MCMECRRDPCSSGCPNYKRTRAIFTCAGCGEGIYKGDEYMVIDGKYFHGECAGELSVTEVLKSFGISSEVLED